MATSERISDLAQRDFLRFAMKRPGMARDDFARRLCLARHTLDRLLLPTDSPQFRSMPETGDGPTSERS